MSFYRPVFVSRRQYAVGQGGFHATVIGANPSGQAPSDFCYAYDCGTASKRRFVNDAIDRVAVLSTAMPFEPSGPLDALFVSHFDQDHVNGIDRLLSRIPVQTVYLPYLDDLHTVLELIEAALNERLSHSLIEMTLDAAGYFGRRGVERVILVSPRGPDDEGPVEPTAPDGFPGEGKVDVEFKPPPEPIDTRGDPAKGYAQLLRLEPMSVGRVTIGGQFVDWVLVPHVTRVADQSVASLRSDIAKMMSINVGDRITPQQFVDVLRDPAKWKELRNTYKRHVGAGVQPHNRISMSLYSGPTGRRGQDWELRRSCTPAWFLVSSGGRSENAVGWLGTGDAFLRQQELWDDFHSFYHSVLPHVGTLSLPHHGAKANFADGLLNLDGLSLAVANSRHNSRHHPARSVCSSYHAKGIPLHRVTQQIETELTELVRSA